MTNVYLNQKRGILTYRLRHACKLAFDAKSKAHARRIIERAAEEVWGEATFVRFAGNCTESEIETFRRFWTNERDAALRAYR